MCSRCRFQGFFVLVPVCLLFLVCVYPALAGELGVIDLRGVDLDARLANLNGSWEFYWKELLEPGDFSDETPGQANYVPVPASWNGYKFEGNKLPGQGYATYRVTVKVDQSEEFFGLKLPRIFTAYKLWVNGRETAVAGTVGTSFEENTPQYLPQQVFFPVENGTAEIVVQVANYRHRSGGILESIQFGSENQIKAETRKQQAYDMFMFGSLLIMGIYHLMLFAFHTDDRSYLYFGLFCLLISIRTLLIGERFLIQFIPNFNWELAHKLQTLCFYLGVYVLVLYFSSAFPKYRSKLVLKVSLVVTALFTLLVVATPARIFTAANPLFQVFTLAIAIYLGSIVLKVIRKRHANATLITIGAAVLILTSLNNTSLSSLGLFVFVVAHSIMLAVQFSDSCYINNALANELAATKENLESVMTQHGQTVWALNERIEQQKRKLQESRALLESFSPRNRVTRVWNRRYFDELLDREWQRGMRWNSHLSVILVDINNFETFSEAYGHQAGDVFLLRVASSIKKSAKRAEDIVAHYAGDEFIILLPNTDRDGALHVARSLRAEIEEIGLPPIEDQLVSLSIGVSCAIPTADFGPEDLIKAAHQGRVVAKQNGNNYIELRDLN